MEQMVITAIVEIQMEMKIQYGVMLEIRKTRQRNSVTQLGMSIQTNV